jgi:hypothetical protein
MARTEKSMVRISSWTSMAAIYDGAAEFENKAGSARPKMN